MHSQKERTTPRISLNKLGEYLVAKPRRRHSIIKDQKKPKDFIVARYTDAIRAIQAYVTDGAQESDQIKRAARSLTSTSHESKWKQETADLCAKALLAFMSIADEVPTNGFGSIRGEDSQERINIAGTEVSVRPEIFLVDPDAGNQIVGAIKLYISKSHPLSDDSAAFIGSVLYRYAAEVVSTEAAVSHKNCFIVDVFDGKIYVAPKAFKRNMNDVHAACSEIAQLWQAA